MELINFVKSLIAKNQEGAYWDFKESWYEKNKSQDLLHDIICFSNNLVNRDSYIIIGVEDNTYEIFGVEYDDRRKTTQNITDFLRDKKFVGSIRPEVVVKTIIIDRQELDIIIIKNSSNTPFYLTERYKGVQQYNIYTRVQDSNTPINRVADFNNIEYLWRKRFGLISTPLESSRVFLNNKKGWTSSFSGYDSIKYYSLHPEFTIQIKDDLTINGYEFYIFNQRNLSTSWHNILIYYHQTLLGSFQGVSLDSGRYFTPTPEKDGFSIHSRTSWDVSFRFFLKDSLRFDVHNFYYDQRSDDEEIAYNRFLECVLIFSDIKEKENFKEYAKKYFENEKKKNFDIIIPHFPQIENYKMESFENDYLNSQLMKILFNNFQKVKLREE